MIKKREPVNECFEPNPGRGIPRKRMSQVSIPNSAVTFLNLRHLPARLTAEQVAAVLGFHPDHIPLLVLGKLLKPLGNPPRNGVKLFTTAQVLEKGNDLEWLDKASRFLTKHWQDKNSR